MLLLENSSNQMRLSSNEIGVSSNWGFFPFEIFLLLPIFINN